MNRLAAVAIGLNEGERLTRCLQALREAGVPTVYVDSGSTDGSVENARSLGAEVVELDRSSPFTAARARNAGFQRIRESLSEVELIQFVDGDCELMPGWLEEAQQALVEREQVAAVCGRVRERHPERSIYNRLCDSEFNRPPGEVAHCGGIFVIRAEAFEEVGGFHPGVVAGEEPELCLRLRRRGWKLLRLERDMCWHDADLLHFGPWWRRMVRGGYAYAQGCALHGGGPERFCVRESLSIWLWGFALPVVALGLAWSTGGWSLLLPALYFWPLLRTLRARLTGGEETTNALLYSCYTVLAKIPNWIGQVQFLSSLGFAKRSSSIPAIGALADADVPSYCHQVHHD